jgi:hypothetical protein
MSQAKPTRRQYRDGKKRLPGVTTIISSVLAKPALMWWAAGVASEATAEALASGLPVDQAIAIGRKAHAVRRDSAADAGTLAHGYVEQWLARESLAVDMADEQQSKAFAAARRLIDWVEQTEDAGHLEVLGSEVPLVDTMSGYGGTLDMVVRLGGVPFLVDFKTGKGVYDETAIQLGAYRCLWNLHNPDVRIDRALVLHSPVEGQLTTHFLEVEHLDAGATCFAALLHIYKTKKALAFVNDDVEATEEPNAAQ